MDNLLYTWVPLEEPGHCETILHVFLHSHRQRLDGAVHQVTVKWRRNEAYRLLEEAQSLVQVFPVKV